MITLLTGGARSGKSRLAVDLAANGGNQVTFLATATAGDDDMAARIARHRDERPGAWTTVEEPVDLAGALRGADTSATVVVDCLTLWLANVLERDDETIWSMTHDAVAAASQRPSPTIVVTNEVGDGIVPADPATRRYRDLLGGINQVWSRAATTAYLVVAGRALPLPPAGPPASRGGA